MYILLLILIGILLVKNEGKRPEVKVNFNKIPPQITFNNHYHNLTTKITSPETNKFRINFYLTNQEIGHVTYKINGQICTIDLLPEFHKKYIGIYMLQQAIIMISPEEPVWAVATQSNHFWPNLPYWEYKDWGKLHPSVRGCGFMLSDRSKFISWVNQKIMP